MLLEMAIARYVVNAIRNGNASTPIDSFVTFYITTRTEVSIQNQEI